MPRLVIRKGEGVGRDHALVSPCIVGRHETATFVLGDSLASRNHFRIVQEGGAWVLEDLGSTNGTQLNGERTKRQRLKDGDRIVAGTTELEFVQKDLLGATRAPVPAGRPAMPPALPAAAPLATASAIPAPPRPVAVAPARVPPPPAKPAVPAPPAPARAAAAPQPPAPPAPAPPAPAKPRIQAPIPTKKRR